MYSAHNHKRATAAKCRESHHRRHDCTLTIGERHSSSCIRSAVVWHTTFCSGGALMIVRTVESDSVSPHLKKWKGGFMDQLWDILCWRTAKGQKQKLRQRNELFAVICPLVPVTFACRSWLLGGPVSFNQRHVTSWTQASGITFRMAPGKHLCSTDGKRTLRTFFFIIKDT
jgi:hypothetical protein